MEEIGTNKYLYFKLEDGWVGGWVWGDGVENKMKPPVQWCPNQGDVKKLLLYIFIFSFEFELMDITTELAYCSISLCHCQKQRVLGWKDSKNK